MKALTLRPHSAWLVVNGYKDIENRSWVTRLRGRVWIHSGTRPVTKAEYEHFEELCRKRRIRPYPDRDGFKLGCIFGSAEITDCFEHSRSSCFLRPYGFFNPEL